MTTRSLVNFAHNIEAFMDVAGMTRTELAAVIGIPLPRITELFSMKYGKTLETVDGVCDSLNKWSRKALELDRPPFTPEMLISEDFNVPTVVVLALQKRSREKIPAATA